MAAEDKYSPRQILNKVYDEETEALKMTGLGAEDDAAETDSTASGSVIAWLKGIVEILSDVWDQTINALTVKLGHALDYENDIVGIVPERRADAWQDKSALAGEDASTAIELVAAVPGEKHYLTLLRISATATCIVDVEDSAGTPITLTGGIPLVAGQTLLLDYSGTPKKSPTANLALKIKSSTSDVIHWDAGGYTMPDPS